MFTKLHYGKYTCNSYINYSKLENIFQGFCFIIYLNLLNSYIYNCLAYFKKQFYQNVKQLFSLEKLICLFPFNLQASTFPSYFINRTHRAGTKKDIISKILVWERLLMYKCIILKDKFRLCRHENKDFKTVNSTA